MNRTTIGLVVTTSTRLESNLLLTVLEDTDGMLRGMGCEATACEIRRVLRIQGSEIVLIGPILGGDPLVDSSLARRIRNSSLAIQTIVFLDPEGLYSTKEESGLCAGNRVRGFVHQLGGDS